MRIAGISAFYHESAAALLVDGQTAFAAAEERFTRVKHDPRLPVHAFRAGLRAAGIDLAGLDRVAYYEDPVAKLERQVATGAVEDGDPLRPEREIRERLGVEAPIDFFDHHLSHAASAFFASDFEEAAVLVCDGVGEWATTSYYRARGTSIEKLDEVRFPHSLGLLYATLTHYLGFGVLSGEYKVMGLAPYGKPAFVDQMRALVRSGPDGGFELDLKYFDFGDDERMHTPALHALFGAPRREPESPITAFHHDVARSQQAVLEEVLLEKVRWLRTRVDSPNLCMAGGVALNCVANGRLLREGPFRKLFVQPAATDAGGALGAAYLSHVKATGRRPAPLADVYLGPAAEGADELMRAMDVGALDYRGREAELLEATVDRLARGEVVAWCHGRMEFGPRALGARSILADPRDPGMRERLNRLVKKREAFRPFAPAVAAGRAAAHFALDHPSPYMLETCQVRSPLALPAITHVDGSARPQTVSGGRFAALLAAFERRTGCPILVNTSFNVRDEPIVLTPVDAVLCVLNSEIDALVLEDWILDRRALPERLFRDVRAWSDFHRSLAPRLADDVYTFL
ncbi:MAG TPA: carbamoyltransferase N-terminal domain-containing protein [Planctomycetota bacterium]